MYGQRQQWLECLQKSKQYNQLLQAVNHTGTVFAGSHTRAMHLSLTCHTAAAAVAVALTLLEHEPAGNSHAGVEHGPCRTEQPVLQQMKFAGTAVDQFAGTAATAAGTMHAVCRGAVEPQCCQCGIRYCSASSSKQGGYAKGTQSYRQLADGLALTAAGHRLQDRNVDGCNSLVDCSQQLWSKQTRSVYAGRSAADMSNSMYRVSSNSHSSSHCSGFRHLLVGSI